MHSNNTNPPQDVSEPPFQIKETGYAGFEIPIEIYFKNREKPNRLVFVHDLCLLSNKPNDASTVEKIKFINPTREFEKCLIKSGAQLLTAPVKKERSNSPPTKKQKSSSLIPSKDMSKQPTPQPQPQKSSSKEFIDFFGAPLVFGATNNLPSNTPVNLPISKPTNAPTCQFTNLQMKISDLSDPDRLQQIVDIVVEAKEWFNLTSNKFEFDLKRLSRKTLSKIERIFD